VLAGCGSGTDSVRHQEPGTNTPVSDSAPIVGVPARGAAANARDVQTLVQTTDAVFVGEVTALSGQRQERLGPAANEGASSNRPEKPAVRRAATFPISVYEVLVRNSLDGPFVAGSQVVIEQLGGLTTRADGSQANIILEGDELLAVGRKYLFFASVQPDGIVTSAPFARFSVSSDGSIAPLEAWAHLPAAQHLAGMSVEAATVEVQSVAR
jgi:hypothetical protein